MKKNFMAVLISLVTISICTAQMKTGITTEEEYNYMVKGYQTQVASGLDMKKGYSIGKTVSITEGSYSFNYMPLLKVDRDTFLVGYIVKTNSSVSGREYWYGLPIGNQDLLDRSFESINLLDGPMSKAFFKSYVALQTNLH